MSVDGSDEWDERLLAEGRLGELLARHYDDLRVIALLRVGPDRADDVLQSALLRTVREHRDGRRWAIPPRAVMRQHLRWAIGDLAGGPRESALPDGWDPADPAGQDGHLSVEDRLSVEALLDRLPPGDRRVMAERYLAGREIQAIADDLDMSRNAVDQALWRGRRALREALGG